MKRNTPLCQTSTGRRSPNISSNRLKMEQLMAADPDREWTVSAIRKAIDGNSYTASHMDSMANSGICRLIRVDARGHRVYVHHTSNKRPDRTVPDEVAGPRMYTNSTQPTMPAEWWAKQLSWGR